MSKAQSAGVWAGSTQAVFSRLDAFGNWLLLTMRAVVWTARPPYRFGQLLAQMEFIGVSSVFIVSLTGLFSGMVLTLQTVNALRSFSAEGIVGYMVAVSMTREISPVFAALMVTARAGSGMAAELGNMRVTEQIDAIMTMGVSPVQYLITPRLLACVLMLPLLCVLYTCAGMAGAWLVGVGGLGVDPGVFIYNIEEKLLLSDFWMGEIKCVAFGFLIASISCAQGFSASGGARGVGIATTRAVVQSAVGILIANYLITSILTDI